MATPQEPAAKPRIVRCPACGGDSVYAPSNPLPPVLQRSAARASTWAPGPARTSACRPKRRRTTPDDEPFRRRRSCSQRVGARPRSRAPAANQPQHRHGARQHRLHLHRQLLPAQRLALVHVQLARATRRPCRSAAAPARADSRTRSTCQGWTAPIVMPISSCSSRRSACFHRFARLDLAARELPVAFVDLARRARGRAGRRRRARISTPTATSISLRSGPPSRGRSPSATSGAVASCRVPARVVARELVGHAAAARAALQRPDQRLGPRRLDRLRAARRSDDSHCAAIARYSSWLNG